MVWHAWLALLASLVAVPLAAATAAEGGFQVDGALAFPAATQVVGAPLALLLPDTGNLSHLVVHAPLATVALYRVPFRGVDPGILNPVFLQLEATETREWTVRDATISLMQGNQEGALGLFPGEGTSLAVQETDEVEWEPRVVSDVGQGAGPGGSQAGAVRYHQRVARPHMHGMGNGSLAYSGAGSLHLVGPDVEVHAANVTRHATGVSWNGPSEMVFTVLLIRFDAPATVEISEVPFEAALSGMDATWDGPMRFTPRDGNLRTDGGVYLPGGGPVEIDGNLTARLLPTAAGESRLTLSGDVRSSSLTFAPTTQAIPASVARSWVALAVLGAVVVAVGGGAAGGVGASWALVRRIREMRPPPPQQLPFSPEDCMEVARAALSQEDWPEALDWLRRAHGLAPASARIAGDLAFCLEQMGAVDDALEWHAKAHALSSDGEAAFNAARAAQDAGKPAGVVFEWLAAALERTPGFVEEVAPEFPSIVALPAWTAVGRRAWERHGLEGRGSGAP
jgi:hypothetical protein